MYTRLFHLFIEISILFTIITIITHYIIPLFTQAHTRLLHFFSEIHSRSLLLFTEVSM